ncbi:MAG: UvrY/SirA/GacA family response regulator transcription factor [Pseudomonadales bacterium]|jgi:two-component system invasion response regulator UvrY
MIRVLIVDDHKLVRIGTARLLADEPGIEIVAEACSGEEAITAVQRYEPDLVLMDVNMPGIGGLEATRRCLRVNPDLKVIIVTMHDHEPFPSQFMNIGAQGYLTKGADVTEMVRAIKKVMRGQRYLSEEIAQLLALQPFADEQTCPFTQLSGREMQIAIMVTNGIPVTEISESLSLSPKTVNSYRYRIFEKLDVHNDVALTKLAIKHRIIDSEAVA